jgi:hypothetical protein
MTLKAFQYNNSTFVHFRTRIHIEPSGCQEFAMNASKLLNHWEQEYGEPLTTQTYTLPLNVKDAAQIAALLEMFPGLTIDRILRDLVGAALKDLAGSFPYVAGNRVVAQDEEGFPVYEDIGPTPQFLELTRKHMGNMNPGTH